MVKASPKRRRSETPSKQKQKIAIPTPAATPSISGGVGSAGGAESPTTSPVAMDTSADEIAPAAACPLPTRTVADLTPAVVVTTHIPILTPRTDPPPVSPTPDALVGPDEADEEAAVVVAPCPPVAGTDEATLGAEPHAEPAAAVAGAVVKAAPVGVLRQTFVLGKDPAFTFEVSPR